MFHIMNDSNFITHSEYSSWEVSGNLLRLKTYWLYCSSLWTLSEPFLRWSRGEWGKLSKKKSIAYNSAVDDLISELTPQAWSPSKTLSNELFDEMIRRILVEIFHVEDEKKCGANCPKRGVNCPARGANSNGVYFRNKHENQNCL